MVIGGKLIMNYQNLIPQEGITKNENKKKRILYVTSIGSEADKSLNRMFKELYLSGPRIKRSKMGQLNVAKYSFEFKDESVTQNVWKALQQTWFSNHKEECIFLRESMNSIYIINKIKFY